MPSSPTCRHDGRQCSDSFGVLFIFSIVTALSRVDHQHRDDLESRLLFGGIERRGLANNWRWCGREQCEGDQRGTRIILPALRAMATAAGPRYAIQHALLIAYNWRLKSHSAGRSAPSWVALAY